jgi:vacuolar-type H+-ATPase subunit I/STV1
MDDTIILEKLRLLALQDNTLGADVMDKFNLITSKSSADIFSKLKDSLSKKERQQQSLEQQQAKQQQDIIASPERQLNEKLQHESNEKELDRQNDLRLQEMKTIGASDFAKESGYDDLMRLRESQLKQQNFYQSLLNDTNKRNQENEQTYFDQTHKTKEQNERVAIEKEKLQVQREQIAARLQDSNNRLKIAKVNK